MKWETAWLIVKDVLLTGTGLTLIILQMLSPRPSDVLIVTALALTVPSAASHAGALLAGPSATGHGPSHSPPSSPPPGSPSSSSTPPQEGAGKP